MRKPKIAMVGLGGIAQKAYLPILTKELEWEFTGAYTPNAEKRKRICSQYRITPFSSLATVMDNSDAVFVHSSTESHFEIVLELLRNGKDVYVDKPLANTIEEAEKLVEVSEKYGRKLMVGFNRRFAPMYVRLKEEAEQVSAIYIEKHRVNGVGPNDYRFTMMDDYIHLVDTALWLADGDLELKYQQVKINESKQLRYTQHVLEAPEGQLVNTSMHRNAGTNLEQVEIVTSGAMLRVKNMQMMEVEKQDKLMIEVAPRWDSILKQKGFEDAVFHFINCVQHDSQPMVDGLAGLKTQLMIERLIRKYDG
ncbi:Gfo/Idh/MocA family protein [Ornithinibacillus contaminans]|uniref:Gfo/Idh/MocA family protein n=1 Tax=Ornithinibacillus contaminans TaxID=694055 RepID=UPI00064DAE02|nr:Gfo/Idh/MocA family oxidoreductase [Ornithinibacillus contaminans]